MGRHTKSKIIKMKLFAILAIAVASRQVNQFAGTNLIDADCTKVGDCGENTECKAPAGGDSLMRAGEKCACLADFVPAENNIDCKTAEPDVEVIVNLDTVCTEADTCGANAECVDDGSAARALMCKCKPSFVADGKTDCKAAGPALGDVCVVEDKNCGGSQECKASVADDKIMTCQCLATHEDKSGVCTLLESDGSAAFYSVATAFLALILA